MEDQTRKKTEENLVIATIPDRIDDLVKIKTAPGGLKHSTTLLVQAMDQLGIQLQRLRGVKAQVPSPHPEYLTHPVEVPEGHHQLPDDGVETGAEPPARDDGSPGSRRVEEDSFARAGLRVGDGVGGRGEIEEDVSEDNVGLGDVESVGRVVEWVVV